ncbi:hypothetical protein OWV82_010752 [Melia azedarach]|uniref:Uncharacterized protein n=1 Tax=Melia azedarach TaxID=155640 RepID=A0ACC1Y620_MELAZ|nr:hypothetical protein OWV82_010752 [Melia azedarach]
MRCVKPQYIIRVDHREQTTAHTTTVDTSREVTFTEKVDIEVATTVETPQKVINIEISALLPETTQETLEAAPIRESIDEPSPMDRRIPDPDNPNVVTVNFLSIVLVYRLEDYATERIVNDEFV